MQSLVLSLEAIAPIFILLLVGYFIKEIKLAAILSTNDNSRW